MRRGYPTKYKNRHPDRVHITRHPNGKITYRIPRRNTPAYRRARNGPARHGGAGEGRARDGPDTHAA